MDSFSVQDEGIKRKSGLVALLMEIGVIVVLIVVIVFVLGYFDIINMSFMFPKQENVQVNQASTNSQSPKISTSPPTNFAVETRTKKLKKTNSINYSNTITEYIGTIKSIDLNGGKIFNARIGSDVNYKVLITFSSGDNEEVLTSYYSEEGLRKIYVFSKKGIENPIPIKIADLKIADKIILNIESSNTEEYPNDLIKATITKVL